MGEIFTQYRDPRYINPSVRVLDLLVAPQVQTGMDGWSPVILLGGKVYCYLHCMCLDKNERVIRQRA
jgi:hypothetical protein